MLKSYRPKLHWLHYNEVAAYKMLKQKQMSLAIPYFYGSWKHGETYGILLQYVPGMTLNALLETVHPSKVEERLNFWSNMIRVTGPLCYIHCHTDPKDSNRVIQG